jgi:hypothetical protein
VHRVLCPGTPKQVQNVCAAAKNNVLAVVDDFVDAGMKIRGRAAAHVGSPFEQLHSVAILRQCTRRSQSGNTTTNHRNTIWIS